MREGWKCPACHLIYAPDVKTCNCEQFRKAHEKQPGDFCRKLNTNGIAADKPMTLQEAIGEGTMHQQSGKEFI